MAAIFVSEAASWWLCCSEGVPSPSSATSWQLEDGGDVVVAGLGVIVVVLLHLSKDGAEGSCWWHRLERERGGLLGLLLAMEN